GHGFDYRKNKETGQVEKLSKTLGNVVEPMDIITKFNAEAFRYFFLRECPFPGDGEFGWERFHHVYNGDLAHNLGNLFSRVVKLIAQNFHGHLKETHRLEPSESYAEVHTETTVKQVQATAQARQHNPALTRA